MTIARTVCIDLVCLPGVRRPVQAILRDLWPNASAGCRTRGQQVHLLARHETPYGKREKVMLALQQALALSWLGEYGA
jgi:hypothetical protein